MDNKKESLQVLATLIKYKWFIIIFVTLVTAASVFLALNLPVQFKSTVNVVLPSESDDGGIGGALGGLSSSLKDFGLTKLGGSSGGRSYDISVLMESRSVSDTMINRYNLLERYEMSDAPMVDVRKAYYGNFEYVDYKEGNIEISFWDEDPKIAAEMANDFITVVNTKAEKLFKNEKSDNIEFLEKRIKTTEERLDKLADTLNKFSRKNKIFSPEEQASSIGEALAEFKGAYYQAKIQYDYAKNKYGENDPTTLNQKEILESTKKQLEEIETEPGFVGNFSISEISEVGMEYMRLYTEYEAFSKLKIFLLPSLEKARLDIVKNNKFFYTVDSAEPAEKKDRPKRSFIVLGAFFGSFILSVLLVLMINGYKNIKQNYLVSKEDLG